MADESSDTKSLGLGVTFFASIESFTGQLKTIREQLTQFKADLESMGASGKKAADTITAAQEKTAKVTQDLSKATQEATKTSEQLATVIDKTSKATTAAGKAATQSAIDFKGLSFETMKMVGSAGLSGNILSSLVDRLKKAGGESEGYRKALVQLAKDSDGSTIRFNQLSSALQSNERMLLQSEAAFGKVRSQLGVNALPRDLNNWSEGLDRVKMVQSNLNGELFKSNGVIVSTSGKFLDLQRQLANLKTTYGEAAWSAVEANTRIGSGIRTISQLKAELSGYEKSQISFSKYTTEAGKAVESAAAAMNQMGLAGNKWAEGVDKGAVATAFARNEMVNANGTILQMGKSFTETSQKIGEIGSKFKSQLGAETFNTIRSQVGTTIGTLGEYKTALQESANRAAESTEKAKLYGAAKAELGKITGATTTAIEKLSGSVRDGGITLDQARSSLVKLTQNHLDAVASTKDLSEQNRRLNARYQELYDSTGKYKGQYSSLVSTLDGSKIRYDEVNEKIKRLNGSYLDNEKAVTSWNTAVKNSATSIPKVSQLVNQLSSDISNGSRTHAEATQVLKTQGAELSKTGGFWSTFSSKVTGGGAAAAQATGYMANLGRAIGSLAAWIPAAMLISALTEAIGSSINAVKEYDQALKSLQAISDGTSAEIGVLGKAMIQISDDTKYSSSEIAKGAIYIAQAGFTASESLNVIGAAARGAQGTLEPLTTAADLLTTTLRAFHIPASEASSVMDMLAMAANKSKTDLEGMKVVFNYLGPAAYSAGVSLNEALGSLMALSNVGMRMSTVGTSLRQVFIGLENPSAKLKAALGALGMTVEDLSVKKMGGLVPVLQNLDKVIGGSLTNAVQFFNVRAGNAALVISQMNEHVAMMIKFTEEYGASAAMASRQSEGMTVQLSMLSNQFQNFIIRASEGKLTDVFKLLISSVSGLISVIEYLVNNPLSNFLITTGALYVSLSTLQLLLVKVGTAIKAYFVGSAAEAAAGALKTATAMSSLSTVFTALTNLFSFGPRLIKDVSTGFLLYTSNVSFATRITELFSSAWKALSLAFATNPLGMAILAISSFTALLYAATTSLEKEGKALQENTITYYNNMQTAEQLAVKLRELNLAKQQGTMDSNSYNAVLKQIVKTYPELIKEITLTKGDLEAQAVALDNVALRYRNLNEITAKSAIGNIAEQFRKASVEAKTYSAALAENKNQALAIVSSWQLIPPLVGGLIGRLFNLTSATDAGTAAWARLKLAWNLTSTQAADQAARKLNEAIAKQGELYPQVASIIINASQSIRKSLIDSIPAGEMRDMALATVAIHDRMVASLKVGVDEVKAKEIDAVGLMGAEWLNYYSQQDKLGQAEVAMFASNAKKKIDAAMKQFKETDPTLRLQEEGRLYQEYYDKMLKDRGKNVENLLKLEDQLYEEMHKRRKAALADTLVLMDLEQKQEIVELGNKQLAEEEYLREKAAIEADYYVKNKAAIEEATNMELAALDSVHQAKMKTLEADKTLTEEARAAKRVIIETENSVKIIAVYREQMAAFKTHITEKVGEFNRYKTEYDKTLKEIQKAEEAHLKVVEEANKKYTEERLRIEKTLRKELAALELESSKQVEDIEKLKRDARQLSMTESDKQADKQEEINDTIAKSYDTLAKAEMEKDSEAKLAKVNAAKDYLREALGMVSSIEVGTIQSDGKMEVSAQKTSAARLAILGQIEIAFKKALDAQNAYVIARSGEALKAAEKERDDLIAISAEKTAKIKEDLEAIAASAKENMGKVTTEIDGMMTRYKQYSELVSKETQITADATQAMAEIKKLTDQIQGGKDKGDYKIVIEFMGKASPITYLTDTVNNISEKIRDLIILLSKTISFVVWFMGDAGGGRYSILSVINQVWSSISNLSEKINNLVTVHTITTQYVTQGSPSEGYAEGGKVPGVGSTDSVPAVLTPGEFVMRKSAVQTFGDRFFGMLNTSARKFADGGMVKKFADGGLVSSSKSTDKFSIDRIFTVFEGMLGTVKSLMDNVVSEMEVKDRKNSWLESLQRGLGLEEGGGVPGTGNSDSVPAMLTPGEFVVRKGAVQAFGEGFFHMVNNMRNFSVPKFAMGGLVPSYADAGDQSKSMEVFTLNLQVGKTNVPLQVLGSSVTMRQSVRKLEEELSRMRLAR